ncbi:cob(I)yrinic acid a,c-diamide adenosyltransferase [Desulfogranum japonicum]|uniref:cob(I)yrinic acid a,c-diamide adenosyltransferase n=1 Tax=Desulfogranum japonicum TaxID=231447 RepID=UPI000416F146|nr:cob(I)yrinic acid a,c-diamide adenosyltransferase [Desulfogranum japonicum]
MKVYTRTGDKGTTRLFSGEQVAKDALRVNVYGALDELQAQLGFCRAQMTDSALQEILFSVQKMLFVLSAEVASTPEQTGRLRQVVEQSQVDQLEAWIDSLTGQYGLPSGFVVPGRTMDSAALHVSRTICRRCERLLITLQKQEQAREVLLRYTNRLSDLLFMISWALEVRAVVIAAVKEYLQRQEACS